MKTLLEKAKEIKGSKYKIYRGGKDYTIEDIDLVLGFLNNEISTKQFCEAKDFNYPSGATFQAYIVGVIRCGVRDELISINKIDKKRK